MNWYLFSLYVHILCVAIWIGGQLFLPLILLPAIQKMKIESLTKRSLLIETGIIFSKVGRWVIIFFILSGLGNFYFKFHSRNIEIFLSSYGEWLIIKIFLFLIMIGINIYHEKKIGFYLKSMLLDENYEKYRKVASITGRITLLLSLIIAFIGIYLKK